MTNLTFTVFQATPDEVAQRGGFCLDKDHAFDVNDYAEVYEIDADDIDAGDIATVQEAQGQLGKDFWIAITHD